MGTAIGAFRMHHSAPAITKGAIVTGTDRSVATFTHVLPHFLIEVHRLDLHHWGNLRTAAVVRCVATDTLADGRPAKVNKIANVLDFGVATVHAHLRALVRWQDPVTGARTPQVHRVPGGYDLTREGWATLHAWSADVDRIRRRLDARGLGDGARPRPAASLLELAPDPARRDPSDGQ
jgi:hypothetical protein